MRRYSLASRNAATISDSAQPGLTEIQRLGLRARSLVRAIRSSFQARRRDLPVAERDEHDERREREHRRHEEPAKGGAAASVVGMDAALFSLVVILERYHHALQRPQHAEGQDQHQRPPQTRCTQIGGLNRISTRSAAPAMKKPTMRITNCAGPSAELAKAIVEAAGLAARRKGQKTLEQTALPAARTATTKPDRDRILRRIERPVLGHPARRVIPSCRQRFPRHRCR